MSDDYTPSVLWRLFRSPIVRRELAVAGRSKKVLISFAAIVLIQAIIQTIIFASASSDESGTLRDPYSTGLYLFAAEAIVLAVTTVVVFPAFSCTSISSERESQTLDLLLLTPLSSWEIIWGKLASAAAISTLFTASAMPFLFIAASFPSVTTYMVSVVIVAQLVLAVFVTAFGMYASVVFKRPIASMIATYVVALGVAGLFASSVYGLLASGAGFFLIAAASSTSISDAAINYLIATIVVTTALYFTFFFLMTVARMKSRNEDRATALRIFATVATIIALLLLTVAYFAFDGIDLDIAEIVGRGVVYSFSIAAITSTVKAIGLDGYGPRQSRRAFADRVAKNNAKRISWFWTPGSAQTYCLSIGLAAALLLGAGLFSHLLVTRELDRMSAAGTPERLSAVAATYNEYNRYAWDDEYSLDSSAESFADDATILGPDEISMSSKTNVTPRKASKLEIEFQQSQPGSVIARLESEAESNPQMEAAIAKALRDIHLADLQASWAVLLIAFLAILSFGMVSWWIALATRRENTGGMLGLVFFWALVFAPWIGQSLLRLSNSSIRPNEGIALLSPLASAINTGMYASSVYPIERIAELVQEVNASNIDIDASKKWVANADTIPSALPGFLTMLFIGLAATFLMLSARRKAGIAMEAANGRWPPPKLPPPRAFTASAKTASAPEAQGIQALYANAGEPPREG